MTKYTVLFTAALMLFISCSSDDNNSAPDDNGDNSETPTELKIHKLNTDYYYNGTLDYSEEIIFDENGKITRINGFNGRYTINTYNAQNNLVEIGFYSNTNELYGTHTYEYNSSNKLIKFTDNISSGNGLLTTLFSYNGNEINLFQEETDKEGKLIFNSKNLLIENSWNSSPNTIYKEIIIYDSEENVSEIKVYSNSDYQYSSTFNFDDKINPLSNDFKSNPLNYFTKDLFNIEFDGYSNYFSDANTTQKTRNNTVYTKSIQYNQDNYPVSATILKNGELREEQTFIYY